MSAVYTDNIVYARDARASGAVSQVLAQSAAAQVEVAARVSVSVGSGGDYPTWAAYRQAIGDAPILGVQEVTLVGDLGAGDPLSFPRVGSTGAWTLTGTPTVLRSGTLGASTSAYDPGPPAVSQIVHDASIPVSWTASGLVGKLIHNVTNDEYTRVLLDLGSKQARVGRTANNWSSGQNYEVLQRPAVATFAPGVIEIAPGGSIAIVGVALSAGDASLAGYRGGGFGAPLTFTRCDLGAVSGCYHAASCEHGALTVAEGSDIYSTFASLYADGLGGVIQVSGGALVVTNAQAQGTAVYQSAGLLYIDAAVFDALAGYPALTAAGGDTVLISLDGTGDDALGLFASNGARVLYYALPTATGSGGDAVIGTNGSPTSWATIGAAGDTGVTLGGARIGPG